jgi:hypothetical protein
MLNQPRRIIALTLSVGLIVAAATTVPAAEELSAKANRKLSSKYKLSDNCRRVYDAKGCWTYRCLSKDGKEMSFGFGCPPGTNE